jgi:hypothetical protein
MIRAVRANQWVARGETLETEALDRAISLPACRQNEDTYQ